MSVQIKKTDDNTYLVAGKPVYIDSEGRPVSDAFQLEPSEKRALWEYLNAEKKIQNEGSEI